MKLISILTCQEAFEANVIKGKLESEGIKCFLINENAATLLPHHFQMTDAGVKIFINVKDLDRAKDIVDLNDQDREISIVCPKCNSGNVKFTLGKNKLKKIFIIFISLFSLSPGAKRYGGYKCKDCKAEFEDYE